MLWIRGYRTTFVKKQFRSELPNGVLVLIRWLSSFLQKLETGLVFQASGMIAPLEFSENLICYRYWADEQL